MCASTRWFTSKRTAKRTLLERNQSSTTTPANSTWAVGSIAQPVSSLRRPAESTTLTFKSTLAPAQRATTRSKRTRPASPTWGPLPIRPAGLRSPFQSPFTWAQVRLYRCSCGTALPSVGSMFSITHRFPELWFDRLKSYDVKCVTWTFTLPVNF